MEHKQVRFLTPNFPKDKIDEEVEREDLRRISPASNAAAAMPLVEDHLRKCGDCREEFEALLAALKAEEGLLEPVSRLWRRLRRSLGAGRDPRQEVTRYNDEVLKLARRST